MSRHLGWPERHRLGPDDLRRLADVLEQQQAERPQPAPWCTDVVAPEQVWELFDEVTP